jgi:CheY-like chemotaxis protein
MDQDSSPGEPGLPISKAILAVLDRHGVPERQRLTTLEAAADMSYQQVRRRMSGESPWNVDEIQRLAAHFGEPLFGLLASLVDDVGHRATLQLGGITLPCAIWLGPRSSPKSSNGPLVAVAVTDAGERTDHWNVLPPADVGDRPAYEIKRLIFEAAPARRVAVVDTDDTLAADIVQFLRSKGLDALAYRSADKLLAALETLRFDGFILDWATRKGSARSLLPSVRTRYPSAPIIILTGPIKAGSAHEQELESMLATHRAQLYEKPTRLLSLFTALDLGFESAPRGG